MNERLIQRSSGGRDAPALAGEILVRNAPRGHAVPVKVEVAAAQPRRSPAPAPAVEQAAVVLLLLVGGAVAGLGLGWWAWRGDGTAGYWRAAAGFGAPWVVTAFLLGALAGRRGAGPVLAGAAAATAAPVLGVVVYYRLHDRSEALWDIERGIATWALPAAGVGALFGLAGIVWGRRRPGWGAVVAGLAPLVLVVAEAAYRFAEPASGVFVSPLAADPVTARVRLLAAGLVAGAALVPWWPAAGHTRQQRVLMTCAALAIGIPGGMLVGHSNASSAPSPAEAPFRREAPHGSCARSFFRTKELQPVRATLRPAAASCTSGCGSLPAAY